MSYILDALRRADAERERGTVPGLHAHPAAAVATDAPAPRAGVPWAWLAAGLLGALVVVLGVLLLTREPLPPAPPPAAMPAPSPAAPPEVAPPMPAPAAMPAPPAAPQAAAPSRPPTRSAPPERASREAPAERVLAIAELPEDVRRALPALSISGSIYSQSAANRFLIVNGALFRENEVLTDGLTLRQIKLKSAVLEFRGYRYEIGY